MLTLFEYLAMTDPGSLLKLERRGLLVLEDYLLTSLARLLRHSAWKRMGRRVKQVRWA